jgi:hypothetical protein
MIPGTVGQFSAGMERLHNRLECTWDAPGGVHMYFGREWPADVLPDSCRATWDVGVFRSTEDGPWRVAGIEAYGETRGTRVDFLDNYVVGAPYLTAEYLPIGPAFEAFAEMVCEELLGPAAAQQSTAGAMPAQSVIEDLRAELFARKKQLSAANHESAQRRRKLAEVDHKM